MSWLLFAFSGVSSAFRRGVDRQGEVETPGSVGLVASVSGHFPLNAPPVPTQKPAPFVERHAKVPLSTPLSSPLAALGTDPSREFQKRLSLDRRRERCPGEPKPGRYS